MIFTCAPENEKRDGVDYRDVKAWFQQCRDYKIDVDSNLNVFTGSMAALPRLRRTFPVCLLHQETETKSVMLLWISLRSRRGIERW